MGTCQTEHVGTTRVLVSGPRTPDRRAHRQLGYQLSYCCPHVFEIELSPHSCMLCGLHIGNLLFKGPLCPLSTCFSRASITLVVWNHLPGFSCIWEKHSRQTSVEDSFFAASRASQRSFVHLYLWVVFLPNPCRVGSNTGVTGLPLNCCRTVLHTHLARFLFLFVLCHLEFLMTFLWSENYTLGFLHFTQSWVTICV